MRHDVHGRRHRVMVEEPFPGGMRHRHHRVSAQDQLVEDGALAQGGSGQHGVQHDDDGHREHPDHPQHILTVGAAEDPVLVLDDGDVGIV